jgi:hypothetical protein
MIDSMKVCRMSFSDSYLCGARFLKTTCSFEFSTQNLVHRFDLPPGNATYSQVTRFLSRYFARACVYNQACCGVGVPVLCGYNAVCSRLCRRGLEGDGQTGKDILTFFCATVNELAEPLCWTLTGEVWARLRPDESFLELVPRLLLPRNSGNPGRTGPG